MGIWIELRDHGGNAVRHMADPSGGTFDAAGDLDRLIPGKASALRLLRYVDPDGDTVFNTVQMVDLLSDVEDLGSSEGNRLKPIERRGLARLKVMAERCRDEPNLYVWFVGD